MRRAHLRRSQPREDPALHLERLVHAAAGPRHEPQHRQYLRPAFSHSLAGYLDTVTITDSNNAQAQGKFSLAVNGPVQADQVIASEANLTLNLAATSFIPVTGSGGTTPYSYSVSPGLPSGLSMDSTSGSISGTPTVSSALFSRL